LRSLLCPCIEAEGGLEIRLEMGRPCCCHLPGDAHTEVPDKSWCSPAAWCGLPVQDTAGWPLHRNKRLCIRQSCADGRPGHRAARSAGPPVQRQRERLFQTISLTNFVDSQNMRASLVCVQPAARPALVSGPLSIVAARQVAFHAAESVGNGGGSGRARRQLPLASTISAPRVWPSRHACRSLGA